MQVHPLSNPGGLPTYQPTMIDDEFDRVFGDHIHLNDGSHLHGSIPDDQLWQSYYNNLVCYPSSQYSLPTGSIGERFIGTLTTTIDGIQNGQNNSEKFFVFIMVILQRVSHIRSSRDIKQLLVQRLDAWDNNQHAMLVSETERAMKALLSRRRGRHTTQALRVKEFARLVREGELTRALHYITTTEPSGILFPSDTSDGHSVQDVLESKHPDPTPTAYGTLHKYDETPPLVPVQITDDIVLKVARRLKGSCGLDGTNAHSLRSWLTRFKQSSKHLRDSLASLAQWMSNELVPWPAIRALLSCRLIALDKNPGVRPIGIGHIWRRAIAKCVLAVAVPAATEACGIDQLCVGLQAGIEGAVHAATKFWQDHGCDDDVGFLMVDAKNAFNEMNRVTMLWTVRHEWPQGAMFSFNCYKHWVSLVAHGPSGDSFSFLSKVGATQGDPLAMIIYGLGLLPLIRMLKIEFADIPFHSWYADDNAVASKLRLLCQYFKRLSQVGPQYGYYPQSKKSVLVVPGRLLSHAHTYINTIPGLNFPICNGHRYLGGFVGDEGPKQEWLHHKTIEWEESLSMLDTASQDYPQATYCVLQKSLQMQWQFVQRVVDCPPQTFSNIEHYLANHLLPHLFGSTPPSRSVTSLPLKLSGLSIYDPIETCAHNYQASKNICKELVDALLAPSDPAPTFSLKDHMSTVSTQRLEMTQKHFKGRQTTFKQIINGPHQLQDHLPDPRVLQRAQSTGAWLSVVPTDSANAVLSCLEFRDALHLRYGLTPPNLPDTCDGCDAPFTIKHALKCTKGGLVILRHNELRDEIAALANAAFTPSAVSIEPLICPPAHRSPAQGETPSPDAASAPPQPPNPAGPSPSNNQPTESHPRERGDIAIRGFFDRAKTCIIDCTIMDLDCPTNSRKSTKAAIRGREKSKKSKYLSDCIKYRHDFVPFVASTDGVLGKEAQSFLQRLSIRLASKWGRPYPPVCGYVNARIALALVRATHLCLRGSRRSTTSLGYSLPPALQMDHAGGFHLLDL